MRSAGAAPGTEAEPVIDSLPGDSRVWKSSTEPPPRANRARGCNGGLGPHLSRGAHDPPRRARPGQPLAVPQDPVQPRVARRRGPVRRRRRALGPAHQLEPHPRRVHRLGRDADEGPGLRRDLVSRRLPGSPAFARARRRGGGPAVPEGGARPARPRRGHRPVARARRARRPLLAPAPDARRRPGTARTGGARARRRSRLPRRPAAPGHVALRALAGSRAHRAVPGGHRRRRIRGPLHRDGAGPTPRTPPVGGDRRPRPAELLPLPPAAPLRRHRSHRDAPGDLPLPAHLRGHQRRLPQGDRRVDRRPGQGRPHPG